MKATHTPGPWRFCDADGNPRPFAYVGPGFYGNPGIFGPKDELIVGCDEYDIFGPGDAREANARLIAAAPELLEALRSVFEHCALVHKHWGEGNNAKQADAAIAAARAAIAKATNE